MALKQLLVTPGEPAGIGPDIVLMAAQQAHPFELVAVADSDLLAERAKQLKLTVDLQPFSFEARSCASPAQSLKVLDTKLQQPCTTGQLDSHNAPYVLACLNKAIHHCQQSANTALVTGPVHKNTINQAGIAFTGHTEYLAAQCKVPEVVMMLCTDTMRVALATTHMPLAEVPAAITPKLLEKRLLILHHALQQQFAINQPHILVAGLNPHAGEQGSLGNEEIQTIIPTLDSLRQQGLHLTGPLPADTLFTQKYLTTADAVFAMYHDQGLPVLKFSGFGTAANITLGLPIVRTSVDHGTACELAGTGKASASSLLYALQQAAQLIE